MPGPPTAGRRCAGDLLADETPMGAARSLPGRSSARVEPNAAVRPTVPGRPVPDWAGSIVTLAWARLSGIEPAFALVVRRRHRGAVRWRPVRLAAAELRHAQPGPSTRSRGHGRVLRWNAKAGSASTAWCRRSGSPISGLYACRDGWVRMHASFATTAATGRLSRLLGLPPSDATTGPRSVRRWQFLGRPERRAGHTPTP